MIPIVSCTTMGSCTRQFLIDLFAYMGSYGVHHDPWKIGLQKAILGKNNRKRNDMRRKGASSPPLN